MIETACSALTWMLLAGAPVALAQNAVGRPPAVEAEALMREGRHAEALAALAPIERRGTEAAAAADLLRARALRALGRLPEAAEAAAQARRVSQAVARPDITARALLLLFDIDSDQGRDAAAATYLEPALTAARASGDATLQVDVLEALGRSARAQGDNPAALVYQTEAIDAAGSSGNVGLLIRALGARSTTLLGLGRFDEALADAQTAYDRAAAEAPSRLKGTATFALAQAQAHLWNLDRAVVLWGEALDHYRSAGLQIGVALSTKQRMETWFALGELDRAAADGAEALRLFERTGSAGTTAELLARLALIDARRGNAGEARAFAARAASHVPAGPRRRFAENDLGLTAMYLGDHEEAVARFTRVLDQSIALGDLEYAWRALHNRGRTRLLQGHPDAAEPDLRQAVATLERMRRTLPEAGLRASFMADRRDVYSTLVEAMLDRPARTDDAALAALAVAEQARARSLVEQMIEADLRAADPGLEQIRREEQAALAGLTALQKRAAAAPPTARPAAREALARAEAAYDALLVSLRRAHGAYGTLVNPAALDAEALRALPRRGEVIVSYLFTFDGGIAWALSRDALRTFRIPGRGSIEAQVRLLNALVLGGDVEGVRAVGASLYAALLHPARDILTSAERLTIVPDGPLHRVPFALMRESRDGGGWLAESLPIALAPSGAVLARLRARDRPPAAGALAAFAATASGTADGAGTRGGLAHAVREVSDIARVVEHAGDVRVNRDAEEAAVKDGGAGRFRILHFAAHATVDETAPRRSAILLGPSTAEDGLLQLNEIAALDLNAQLVVAAACRSHLGRSVGGEGLMSLSRAFLQAGADAVVASLWDVDDAETRRFMRLFYAELRAGTPPDDALRRTQQEMLRRGGAAALPRNWAGFVITGDAAESIFAPPRPAQPSPLLLALVPAALALLWRLRRRRAGAAATAQ